MSDAFGVIFDLDGVLVDSMPSHVRAWRQAFREVAGLDVDARIFYLLEGMRGVELAARILADNGADVLLSEQVEKEKAAIFREMDRPPAFEGASELVVGLKCAKAVVSGSSRRDVESVLDASAIGKGSFDVLVTADDVRKGKPDPLAFNTALQKLGLAPAQAVVVENAPLGVKASNSAGIPCYVVLNNTLLGRQDFAGLVGAERMFDRTSSLKGRLLLPSSASADR
jgi:HAD superfamily hydrolase (TIGR01509 family)